MGFLIAWPGVILWAIPIFVIVALRRERWKNETPPETEEVEKHLSWGIATDYRLTILVVALLTVLYFFIVALVNNPVVIWVFNVAHLAMIGKYTLVALVVIMFRKRLLR